MKTRVPAAVLLSVVLSGAAWADRLAGVSDITVVGGALVSIRFEGTEYVVANEDLMLGTTTRWYIPLATGMPTLWVEGAPVPTATVPGTSDPKSGDVGSKGDNFLFTLAGATNISSIDGISFQETIFPLPTKRIFVFERGGNDNGTVQPILLDGSLGAELRLTANGAPYANTGVNVNGQNAFGYAVLTDVPVKGVRITASGHDTLSISAVPVRSDPKQSREPQPKEKATDVPRNVVLSWMAGEGATAHDVYFGTSVADVNNASRTAPRGVLVRQGQSATTYDAGALEFGMTYYWRVDEISGAAGAPFKGTVWSFTVEPYAYPIAGVTASASSEDKATTGPANTVNGSGLANDQHSTVGDAMWLSSMFGAQPTWIRYAFDRPYKLHELWVWNHNSEYEPVLGYGLKDVTIEYSTDGTTWTLLKDAQLARAPALAGYAHNTTVALDGVTAQYVRLTAKSNWSAVGIKQYGLSEVRFFHVPVQAREPAPADGAKDVALETALRWRPGREAASHRVYFGQNKDAVAKGTAPAATTADLSFIPDNLAFGTTYYWRVDEVGAGQSPAVYGGAIWSFTTQAYAVVDDFESYTDAEGNRIYEAWLDGFGTTTNGSQVGYAQAPFAEGAIVHGGRQSMPLAYNNAGGFTMSEAELAFAPQDWTRAGIATLAIHFRGHPDNTPGRLYAKINGVKVIYNGDPAALKTASWTRWDIDLASVNTNLTRVTRLALGFDSGGQGIIYVDNIRLLPAAKPAAPAAPGAAAVTITVASAHSVQATGNDGMIQSIDGIAVSGLVLGATTADFEKYPAHPAKDADNFSLATYASLDEAKIITVKFPVAVTTIFIIERGANDSGLIQALNAAGEPVGEPQPFATAHWFRPGLTIEGQAAGAIAITSSAPIWGITLLPPPGGIAGVDPASISAVPAK